MSATRSFTLPDSRAVSYKLESGPENAPIVVLANSLTSNFESWDHVVEKLAANGLRALRWDQPGHGKSSAPADLSSTTFDSIADDVARLLKHLGLSAVHAWVGVSMGAAAGVVFVNRHPGIVNKLVVCDTIAQSPVNAGTEDLFSARVSAARKDGTMDNICEGTLERWFGKEWIAANPQEAARMRALMRTTSLDGFETCCAALRSKTFDLYPLLEKVAAGCNDVLLIVGEKDADLPTQMQKMRSGIEQGFRAAGKSNSIRLEVIKNAGHVCYIDGLEQFNSLVVPFLKQ